MKLTVVKCWPAGDGGCPHKSSANRDRARMARLHLVLHVHWLRRGEMLKSSSREETNDNTWQVSRDWFFTFRFADFCARPRRLSETQRSDRQSLSGGQHNRHSGASSR